VVSEHQGETVVALIVTPASSWKVIGTFVMLELFILLASWWLEPDNLTALQTTTRFSGRLSLLLFSAMLVLSTYPFRLQRWLSDRYYLLFAIVHGIHLAELMIYVDLAQTKLIPYRLIGGFLAYLFIFIMPWLATRYRAGRIQEGRFRIAESIYFYYVWFIFFMTYFSRVRGKLPNTGGTYTEHVALFGWVLIALILHLVIRFRKRTVGIA
jgi:hypothetical protein